jgi:hypothetical protein
MSPKSLLYTPNYPLQHPPACSPGRQEVNATFAKDGRLYNVVLRDRIIPEDPYLVLVKAAGFAVHNSEPYMGRLVPRSVRDFLIKSNVVVG